MCSSVVWKPDGSPARPPGSPDPYPRPAGTPARCVSCPKVPKHLKEQGRGWVYLRAGASDMTARNRRAWEFYQACRAVGRFPDDPLVFWYAGAVAREVGECERAERRAHDGALLELATALIGRFAHRGQKK